MTKLNTVCLCSLSNDRLIIFSAILKSKNNSCPQRDRAAIRMGPMKLSSDSNTELFGIYRKLSPFFVTVVTLTCSNFSFTQ